MEKDKIKICHLITGLETGGAETLLQHLVSELPSSEFENIVISLTGDGPIADRIRASGVPVRVMGMSRYTAVRPFARLLSLLKEQNPTIIHTWLYHADLVGTIASKLAGIDHLIWGVHNQSPSPDHRFLTALCSRLSGIPRAIVTPSQDAAQAHQFRGYRESKFRVIPNGVDTQRFRPDRGANQRIRDEIQVSVDVPLVGMAARFHPKKGYKTFLEAAGKFHRSHPQTRFVLCGEGVTWENPYLTKWASTAGIEEAIILLGHREDIHHVFAALDIAVVASTAESFSLVLAEAMACGTACAITDLNAPVDVLGGAGWVFPPNDSLALARTLEEILDTPRAIREEITSEARERVRQNYSQREMIEQYTALYKDIAEGTENIER